MYCYALVHPSDKGAGRHRKIVLRPGCRTTRRRRQGRSCTRAAAGAVAPIVMRANRSRFKKRVWGRPGDTPNVLQTCSNTRVQGSVGICRWTKICDKSLSSCNVRDKDARSSSFRGANVASSVFPRLLPSLLHPLSPRLSLSPHSLPLSPPVPSSSRHSRFPASPSPSMRHRRRRISRRPYRPVAAMVGVALPEGAHTASPN